MDLEKLVPMLLRSPKRCEHSPLKYKITRVISSFSLLINTVQCNIMENSFVIVGNVK